MNSEKLLDQWLSQSGIFENTVIDKDIWVPGFNAELRVVKSNLGPFSKIFQRPEGFEKRFYQRVYTLPIAEWPLSRDVSLYNGLCLMHVSVAIRFQASVKFAKANSDQLHDINGFIKNSFQQVVVDQIDHELQQLEDGQWINTGIQTLEKRLDTALNELIALKSIYCRTKTTLQPEFLEVTDETEKKPDIRFAHESVYSNLLQKNFEFKEKQKQQSMRLEKEAEGLRLAECTQQHEMLRKQQALEAEATKQRLLEKETHLLEQQTIEKRMHEQSTKHVLEMREKEQDAELEAKEKLQLHRFKKQQQMQQKQMARKKRLQETEVLKEIEAEEFKQEQWNSSRQRTHAKQSVLEKDLKEKEMLMQIQLEEVRDTRELKKREKLEKEKIMLENRMKEMQLEAEISEQKKRFDATTRSADYLRREIELLVLEKQRTDLQMAIANTHREEGRVE